MLYSKDRDELVAILKESIQFFNSLDYSSHIYYTIEDLDELVNNFYPIVETFRIKATGMIIGYLFYTKGNIKIQDISRNSKLPDIKIYTALVEAQSEESKVKFCFELMNFNELDICKRLFVKDRDDLKKEIEEAIYILERLDYTKRYVYNPLQLLEALKPRTPYSKLLENAMIIAATTVRFYSSQIKQLPHQNEI